MNNHGQTGIVSFFTVIFVFVIIWAFWLGAHFSTWGALAVANNGLVGLEAFLYMNINLVIFFCLFIASAGALFIARGAT